MFKTSLIWDKVEADKSKERPTTREGHVVVYLNDQNKYLLFGGISNVRYSDVYTLSLTDNKWEYQRPKGKNNNSENPKELSYCIGWYDAPNFFIHGGRNKETALPDIYFLNTQNWVWKKISQIDQPAPRYHHAAAKTNNREVYIFGGHNDKTNKNFAELLLYDYTAINFNSYDKIDGGVWSKIENSTGSIPSARKGHQMVYHNGTIILYGGMSDYGLDDDKFYQYIIKQNHWKTITITGVNPGARAHHSMSFFKPEYLVIFGGKLGKNFEQDYLVVNDLFYIDVEGFYSSTPFVANIGPSARFGHSSTFNSNFFPPEHVIIGGLDKTYGALDAFVVREIELTSDKKWVYEQRKLHASTNVNYEDKDEIFETAKKAIIHNKKQLETLEMKNLKVNREYSELFNQLSYYKKSMQDDDLNTNERRSKQKQQKIEIEQEKLKLNTQAKELRDYNNYVDIGLHLSRNKFILLNDYLEEIIKVLNTLDSWISKLDKSPNKVIFFGEIDLDLLVGTRKKYKENLKKFLTYFNEISIYEKDLYSNIQHLQTEEINSFKHEYFLGEDRKIFSFKDRNNSYMNDSLDY